VLEVAPASPETALLYRPEAQTTSEKSAETNETTDAIEALMQEPLCHRESIENSEND
jgi:hypothetical protein